jgi:hypothetical protein
VREAVAQIRQAGKAPALRGYNRFAQTALMTPAVLARRDRFDVALRAEAWALGVPFIDVGSVPFSGVTDLCPDELHPSLDYHWRIARFVAKRLAMIQVS